MGADPAVAAENRLRQRIEAAKATMTRLQRALEAGWDPDALMEQYNAAVAEKKAAEAGLEAVEPSDRLTAGEIRAMVDELGDVESILALAEREDLAELYKALRLSVSYDHRW